MGANDERRAGVGRWRAALDIVATVVMLTLAGVVVWQGRARLSGSVTTTNVEAPLPTEPIAIGASEVRGMASAPVAIVEYADFDCPFCAQFAQETEPLIVKEYVDTGKVQLVFKHFPLPSHTGARPAAVAAWCAGREGKFLDMHDWLFRLRDPRESDLEKRAKEIGLNMVQYRACRAGDDAARQVEADTAEGERLGVTGTPTFFIGKVNADRQVEVTKVYVGGKQIEELRPILDGVLGS